MITEKIKERLIKAYVKAKTDGKYTFLTYGTYLVATVILTSSTSYAADDIVGAATNLITELQSSIRAVSTAAAAVGVGCGAFFKKFSLGKMDRIETGNKLITNSIWGWVLINGITLILNWANKYVGDGSEVKLSND